MKGENQMKDSRFDNICIPIDALSSISSKLILLVADKEYEKAQEIVNDILTEEVSEEKRELAALIYLQILILNGHEEIAKILLKEFQRSIKTKAVQSLCMRTLAKLD